MESQQIFKSIKSVESTHELVDDVMAAHKMGSRTCVYKDEYQRLSSNAGETYSLILIITIHHRGHCSFQ